MLGVIADGEQATVNFRMQRLDATAENFRKARQVAHIADIESGVAQQLRRAACRQQFDLMACEPPREVNQSRLV